MITFLAPLLLPTVQATGLDVLILDDGGEETAELVKLLEGKGHTVSCSCDDGLLESDFDGSQWSLADQAVVIWLDGDLTRDGEEMPADGQQALVDHIGDGGGLLHFAATSARYAEEGENATAVDLLLLEATDLDLGGADLEVVDGAHPITASYGTGDTFSLSRLGMVEIGGSVGDSPLEWTPVDGGSASVALSTQDHGDGRIAQFAWVGYVRSGAASNLDYGDAHAARLLTAAVQFVARRPPTVDPGGPYHGDPGDFVLLSGSASDPDGGEVSCAWDFDGDGTSDSTDLLTTYDASAADGPLEVDLALTCTDDEGDTSTESAELSVPNLPPRILDVSIPFPAQEGVELELAVEFEDPEPADTHTVTWDLGDGTTSTGTPISHTYASDGSYEVEVTVTDDDLGSDSRSFAWSVHNVGPAVMLQGDTEGEVGEVLTFTCETSDQGDDPVAISWDMGDGTTIGHLEEVKHAYVAAGTFTVTCEADDGVDTATATLVVEIVEVDDNAPPGRPELIRPWNGEHTGSTVELVVGPVADPDGSIPTLDIVLERFDDGTDQGTWLDQVQGVTQTSVQATDLAPGTYRWLARGVDVHGLAGDWSVPRYFEVLEPEDTGDGPWGCGCRAAPAAPPTVLVLWLVAWALSRRTRAGDWEGGATRRP